MTRRKRIVFGILGGLVVLVAGFVVLVAMQPSRFEVARSATMAASPRTIFSHVNNLRRWEAWSPWTRKAPETVMTYEGPPEGTGSAFTWAGDELGKGRMTVLESRPDEFIRLKLEFIEPFEDTSTAEFRFEPADGQTRVIWSMHGENDFISKAMCLFMDMEGMIGNDFEQGLAELTKVAESASASMPAAARPMK